jgi:DNA-binding SARP family transcriptional activator/pimeloyl-ACP methyl ester carboxylesterase
MEFRILGPLQVVGERGEHEVRGAKAKTLLGVLIVHANEIVPTDTLVDALWGDAAPPSANTTLQTYISQLRRTVGTEPLRTRAPGYALDVERNDVDALRFEDALADAVGAAGDPLRVVGILTPALASWRGRALADFDGSEWSRVEAVRLDAMRLDAIERLIDARLSRGEHLAVAPELEALVHEHPLRERFWAQLMLALYRCNRQADALRAYERLRVHLRDELGVDPSHEVSELEAAILEHAPSLRAPRVIAGDEPPASRRLVRPVPAAVLAVLAAALVGGIVWAATASSSSTRAGYAPRGYQPRYRVAACPDFVRSFDSTVTCGVLTVPEDRRKPNARTVELDVFRYPSRAAHPAPDPVVQLGDRFRFAESPSDGVLRDRGDSVYLAARGFYGSTPRLTCPDVAAAARAALSRLVRDPESTASFARAAATCRAQWAARGVDVAAYSAAERADDVRDLAFVMHWRTVDLIGTGSQARDAREIASRYPELVRSITLFNVTPPDANGWNGAITNARAALDRLAGECANSPSCRTKYPELRRRMSRVEASLEARPQLFAVSDPASHAKVGVLLDGDRTMLLTLIALDDPSAIALVPAAYAPSADPQADADYAASSLLTPPDSSWGALLSRACVDEGENVGRSGLDVEAHAEPELAFLADDPLLDACSAWSTPGARAPAAGPVRAPVLILQGDLDPFTSRDWGQQAARSLGHATVLVLPHLGNVAVASDACVAAIRDQFLTFPTRPIPANACVREIAPIRFAGT